MAKAKTSIRRAKSSRSIKSPKFDIEAMAPIRLKKGVHLQEHNPDEFLKDRGKIRDALIQSIFEGDVDAFKEILAAHLRTLSKDDLSKKTGISRATVFRIVDKNSNPSFENVAKILSMLKLAS